MLHFSLVSVTNALLTIKIKIHCHDALDEWDVVQI